MKRRIAILSIIMAFLAACQDEISLKPAASLFSAQPEMTDTTAIFRLAVANVSDSTQTISFPIILGGSAERGVDYTVSADAFIFGGESPVDSIVVTTLKLGTDKNLSLTVQLPEGFDGGKYLTSGFTLQDKRAYISFTNNYRIVTDSTDISFELMDRDGQAKTVPIPVEVSLCVNVEKSTAVEGKDFMFSDSTRFVIKDGESSGSLELRSLNPEPAEGMDKIVLNMRFNEDFGCGEVQEIEIDLMDPRWNTLNATWTIDSLITDSLYMNEYWKDECTGYSLLPEFNETDKISINLSSLSFNPAFTSTFSYFFTNESSIRKGKVIDLMMTDGLTTKVQTFILNNTNRYFSLEESSEDKESYVGLRLIEGEEDKKGLDLYLIDHNSRTFMPELETTGKYAPEKPVAASPGLYLNATFTKE